MTTTRRAGIIARRGSELDDIITWEVDDGCFIWVMTDVDTSDLTNHEVTMALAAGVCVKNRAEAPLEAILGSILNELKR